MSEPLTMSAEREAELRSFVSTLSIELGAELDAERAAHKRTQETLDIVTHGFKQREVELRHSREVPTGLLSAAKEYHNRSCGRCYSDPSIGARKEQCNLADAIALAERDSDPGPGSSSGILP